MEFEEQIKLLAREIYEKTARFIYNNKGNDDIFYEYAYLNLNNEMQVMFSFSKGILYITKSDIQGFRGTLGYEVKIYNIETKYRLNNITYETLLNEKIAKSNKETQRHAYKIELDKQQKLTGTEKSDIRNYYEQLNKEIDNMSYNTQKTHNVTNFNDDVLDVYFEYMYEKELSKIENIPNRILPSVQVAVDWWSEIISDETRGGNMGNDIDSKILMTFSDILYSKNSISSEQITKFKEILARKIMAAIYEYEGDTVQINCDYGPDILLYEAMKESGINTTRTPFKTNMYIKAHSVEVKYGYGAEYTTLFDSTEESDIQIVKSKYCKANQIILDKQREKGFSKVLKKGQ